VGVDVVRTTMPKAIKPYVKKIIETMMVSQNRKATNDVVNEAYEVFKSLKPEELAYTSGMSDYDKYASKSREMNMPKGTPVHVKSAHAYNTLIKNLNIENKYEVLQSGDKVRWMYIKHPNKYNMQSIAFKYYYPQEFVEAFEPDYEKMFEKIVFSVVERFYAAVRWSAHKPNEQVKSDLLDLFA
jgi:DNA polymerase elongation subunit (family B)